MAPGAPSTGSPTPAGRSRCCTASAPAATSSSPWLLALSIACLRSCSRRCRARDRRLAAPRAGRGRRARRTAVFSLFLALWLPGGPLGKMGAPLGHARLAARRARSQEMSPQTDPRRPAAAAQPSIPAQGAMRPVRARCDVHGEPPLAHGRARASRGAGALIELIEQAGLRGRGGAAFPTRREDARGSRQLARARRSSSSTPPRASRRASRTARCSRACPTWCSTAARWPPQAVGADEIVALRRRRRRAAEPRAGDRRTRQLSGDAAASPHRQPSPTATSPGRSPRSSTF